MKTIEVTTPIYKFHFDGAKSLNKQILERIKTMGKHPLIHEDKISNTDWHTGDVPRTYFQLLLPRIDDSLQIFKKWGLVNFWFQQYENGDFHNWHVHGNCMFSSVYYVELPEKKLSTTFRVNGKEYQVDVEEGDYLVFPSVIEHCSKENKSKKRKTIISVNLNIDY